MNRAVTSLNGGSLEITLTVPFSKDEIIEKLFMKCIIQIFKRNIYVYSSYTYKGCLIDWLIITFRFEKLFGVEECLQHPLIKQHISHWFRDNNIHFFREIYLFYLPWDNLDKTRDISHWFRDNNIHFFREIYLFYLSWDNLKHAEIYPIGSEIISNFSGRSISSIFPEIT